MSRETIAYGLIILILVVLIPWLSIRIIRRRREKLRRRGVKKYGH